MAEFSWFWNSTTVGDASSAPYNADTEFADWSRRGFGIGANRNDAGVVLGTGSEATQLDALQVTENSPAGMSVLLNIGCALVNGTLYVNDTALTVAVAANASGNPRIDTIVLRKSWAAQTVRAAILQGTPAASPVPPSLTQTAGVTWEIPIADIAVANGAASITNAEITSRALYTSAADGVYLDRILNNSGAIRQTGDVVINDTSADRAMTTTVLANNPSILGVVVGRIAAAGFGRVLSRGIGRVRTTAAVTRGDFANTSTTAGSGLGTGTERLFNTFAQFLETTSAGGLALARVDAGIKPNYGKLIANVSGASASITIDNLPQFYPVYVIEMILSSGVVGTNENIIIRFGSAGGGAALDATATNYYSYVGTISNSVPILTAISNLGATAGIIINVPGTTATAAAFYCILQISGVNDAAAIKTVTGAYFEKLANTNGNIIVANVGGYWNGAGGTKALEQIRLTTVGGNTVGAEINIYGKDGVVA